MIASHRHRFGGSLILLLMLPLLTLAAPLPELLKPVDDVSIARLQDRSNFGLRGQLYSAKRSRIVLINFDVLEQEGAQFTITPFDDLQMTAVAKELRGPSSYDELTEWRGELVSGQELYGTDSAGKQVTLPPMSLDLWVRNGDHEVPPKLAKELAREARDAGRPAMSPTRSDAASDAPGQAVVTKVALRTLTGRWFVPQLGTSVVIQPVEDDPRFHVIYVEDSTKVVRGTHALDEAQQQKLQRQRQFQEQLNEERKAQEAREQ
jgi:hypothetical protein